MEYENHFKIMNYCLNLAKQGEFTTLSNPNVACIIIKNNEIIGKGFHKIYGENHAEINAILDAKKKGFDVKNSTVYVNLEPCSHFGKTPPCCNYLVQEKVKKVIIGMRDPNPLVSCKGIDFLKKNNIEVIILEDFNKDLKKELYYLNKEFIKAMNFKKPFITLKLASSLDGKIALKNGQSKWITGEKSRFDVQKLRAKNQALITGINTVLIDNPSLNVRIDTINNDDYEIKNLQKNDLYNKIKSPLIIILDSNLKIPENSKVLEKNCKVLIVTKNKCINSTKYKNLLKNQKVEIISCEKNNKIDLEILLEYLYKNKIYKILVESGNILATSFLEQNLIDEIIIYKAPILMGKSGKSLFNFDISTMNDKKIFKYQSYTKLGEDLKLVLVKI